jgi:hypothetical protein
MDVSKIGCEDVKWSEMAQDYMHWQTVLLAVVNLWVMVPAKNFPYL